MALVRQALGLVPRGPEEPEPEPIMTSRQASVAAFPAAPAIPTAAAGATHHVGRVVCRCCGPVDAWRRYADGSLECIICRRKIGRAR